MDGGGRKVYDDETLMGVIVRAEGGRARFGVSGHVHVDWEDRGSGMHGLRASFIEVCRSHGKGIAKVLRSVRLSAGCGGDLAPRLGRRCTTRFIRITLFPSFGSRLFSSITRSSSSLQRPILTYINHLPNSLRILRRPQQRPGWAGRNIEQPRRNQRNKNVRVMILMSPPRIAAVLVALSQSIPKLPEGLWEGGPKSSSPHFVNLR